VKTRTQRNIEGIETHRTRRDERGTEWRGIPITTIPATLVDIAPWMPTDQLARACHEAQVRFNVRPEAFPPRMPRTLRAILHGDIPVTLSELERHCLERLREQGLPLPITNCRAGTKHVDCRWPGHRLTVELDSYRYHHTRHAWEQDRAREREAHARGDRHRRYTYADVFENPTRMLAELDELLA
jgi:hypothetical protein